MQMIRGDLMFVHEYFSMSEHIFNTLETSVDYSTDPPRPPPPPPPKKNLSHPVKCHKQETCVVIADYLLGVVTKRVLSLGLCSSQSLEVSQVSGVR